MSSNLEAILASCRASYAVILGLRNIIALDENILDPLASLVQMTNQIVITFGIECAVAAVQATGSRSPRYDAQLRGP
jgi:hypothetical protein